MLDLVSKNRLIRRKRICVALEQRDADFIEQHGYSPTKLLRIQIQRLRESTDQKVLA